MIVFNLILARWRLIKTTRGGSQSEKWTKFENSPSKIFELLVEHLRRPLDQIEFPLEEA